MYLRELEEGSLERATIMDRVASRALQVGMRASLGLAGAPVLMKGLMPQAKPAGSWGGDGTRLGTPKS